MPVSQLVCPMLDQILCPMHEACLSVMQRPAVHWMSTRSVSAWGCADFVSSFWCRCADGLWCGLLCRYKSVLVSKKWMLKGVTGECNSDELPSHPSPSFPPEAVVEAQLAALRCVAHGTVTWLFGAACAEPQAPAFGFFPVCNVLLAASIMLQVDQCSVTTKIYMLGGAVLTCSIVVVALQGGPCGACVCPCVSREQGSHRTCRALCLPAAAAPCLRTPHGPPRGRDSAATTAL